VADAAAMSLPVAMCLLFMVVLPQARRLGWGHSCLSECYGGRGAGIKATSGQEK